MATLETLRDEVDGIDRLLAILRELRLAIVSGGAPTPQQLERVIAFLENSVALGGEAEPQQTRLLAILRQTVRRLSEESGVARRQFFHAARAYLTARKGSIADSARFLAAEPMAMATA
jgi:hypothetical protein